MRLSRQMPLLVLLLAFVSACSSDRGSPAAGEGVTRVILVRHAEKKNAGSDPPLTGAGREWAEELAGFAAREGVDGVISTPARRTLETATPAGEAVGVGVLIVPINPGENPIGEHADAVVRLIEAHPETRVWLVVGHSNTVPALISRLGGPPVIIEEDDYGTIYLVGIGSEGFRGLRTRTLKVGG